MTGLSLDSLSEGMRYAIGVGTGAGGGVSDTDESEDSGIVDVTSWVLNVLFEGGSTHPGKCVVFGKESTLADAISVYMHVKTKY